MEEVKQTMRADLCKRAFRAYSFQAEKGKKQDN